MASTFSWGTGPKCFGLVGLLFWYRWAGSIPGCTCFAHLCICFIFNFLFFIMPLRIVLAVSFVCLFIVVRKVWKVAENLDSSIPRPRAWDVWQSKCPRCVRNRENISSKVLKYVVYMKSSKPPQTQIPRRSLCLCPQLNILRKRRHLQCMLVKTMLWTCLLLTPQYLSIPFFETSNTTDLRNLLASQACNLERRCIRRTFLL